MLISFAPICRINTDTKRSRNIPASTCSFCPVKELAVYEGIDNSASCSGSIGAHFGSKKAALKALTNFMTKTPFQVWSC